MSDRKSTLSVLGMTSLPVIVVASAVVLLGVLAFLLNGFAPALGM
jgi:hypothetical protein